MSDLIEEYLKSILNKEELVEIRRSEMANLFSCVPSQINYVINTRFTLALGYIVESKRGGGGYIRIQKVKLSNHDDTLLRYLKSMIGDTLTYNEGVSIIQQLKNKKILTENEALLLSSVIGYEAIGKYDNENKLRSNMLRTLIDRLSYEEKG